MYEKLPQLAWKAFSLPEVPFFHSFISPFATWAGYFWLPLWCWIPPKQNKWRQPSLLGALCVLPWAEGELVDLAPRLIPSKCLLSFSSISSMPSHIVFLTVVIVLFRETSTDGELSCLTWKYIVINRYHWLGVHLCMHKYRFCKETQRGVTILMHINTQLLNDCYGENFKYFVYPERLLSLLAKAVSWMWRRSFCFHLITKMCCIYSQKVSYNLYRWT